MTGTEQTAAARGQLKQRLGFGSGLGERLLDVDMRTAQQRLAGQREVGRRMRTHVHDVRTRVLHELGHGCVCGGVSAPGEVLRGLCLDVAHADDLMRGCDALQGVEVSASHMAGADEGDSEHRHRPLQDQSQAQEQKPAEAGEGPVARTPQRGATSRSQPAARMLRHQPASWFST